MSKELEAFYKVKDKLIKVEGKTIYGSIIDLTNLDIIENALNQLEELEKEYDNDIKGLYEDYLDISKNYAELNEKYQELEKVLKIIKEKGVDIFKLKECKRCKLPKEYNMRSCYSRHKEITQDEFDLFKRVLL